MAVLMTFSSAFCVSVSAASSPDEAVISGNYDGIEPIPTEKPEDKPVKHGKGFSSGDYAVLYSDNIPCTSCRIPDYLQSKGYKDKRENAQKKT